ncbi:glycoside hydrolase family 18 protein [Colletotrichum truncatum]|uniref:Glycoside hydrolase family 18 protein n=1 Tax=Colletotrichum truncatum TaxID=5467 RepID=A0ACC3ZG66_COLTU|nr:glycoside hydrolase family 18 protein [Colletotrichum truncatum]KAF6802001.1 glycoside hydrolase family 18 protein [Colletotrichum truncatum]
MLVMYGCNYTLADPSCNDLQCLFASLGKPALCTNFGDVNILFETKQFIKKHKLTPKYLTDSMTKQITSDDQ